MDPRIDIVGHGSIVVLACVLPRPVVLWVAREQILSAFSFTAAVSSDL